MSVHMRFLSLVLAGLLGCSGALFAAQSELPSAPQALAEALLRKHPFVDSVLFAQQGQLQVELYRNERLRDRAHPLRSAGKSLISIALGVALGPKRLGFTQLTVNEVYHRAGWMPAPDAKSPSSQITFHHVLTMTSGITCEIDRGGTDTCDPRTAKSRFPWREYLRKPLKAEPGTQFSYTDAAPTVIRPLIYALTRKQAEDILEEQVFKPLNFSAKSGIGEMTSRDMLKIGQLMLQNGCWDGVQRIPVDWVKLSTFPHHLFNELKNRGGYGYFWWWRKLEVAGQDVEFYYAAGNGGQLIFIIPHFEAVLVTTGHAYDNMSSLRALIQSVQHDILPNFAKPLTTKANTCGKLLM